MPAVNGIKVVQSGIHGYGVVATRRFAAGELIAEVDGVPRGMDEQLNDEYCLWVNEGRLFDMVDQTRYINHSCAPNATVEAEEETDGRVWARITAMRNIEVGEEISYDYAFELVHAVPCACGARTCRGFIVDEDLADEMRARVLRSA